MKMGMRERRPSSRNQKRCIQARDAAFPDSGESRNNNEGIGKHVLALHAFRRGHSHEGQGPSEHDLRGGHQFEPR